MSKPVRLHIAGVPLFGIGVPTYLLLFSAIETYGQYVQISAICIIATFALISLNRSIPSSNFSVFEIALVSISILSIITSTLNGNGYSSLYSVLFLISGLSISTLVRSCSFRSVIDSITLSFVMMILTVFIFYGRDILDTLSHGGSWSFRLSPFNLHPNLVGYIFGGGFALMCYCGLISSTIARVIYTLCALLCLSFVLAASARAGLAAASLAFIVAMALRLRSAKAATRIGVIAVIILGAAIVVPVFSTLISYLDSVLELSSQTRGWNSGGTGRLELWSRGVALLFSDPVLSLFGTGLRSADPDTIGFSTESSYITIFLEGGTVLPSIFLFSLFAMLLRATNFKRHRWVDFHKPPLPHCHRPRPRCSRQTG